MERPRKTNQTRKREKKKKVESQQQIGRTERTHTKTVKILLTVASQKLIPFVCMPFGWLFVVVFCLFLLKFVVLFGLFFALFFGVLDEINQGKWRSSKQRPSLKCLVDTAGPTPSILARRPSMCVHCHWQLSTAPNRHRAPA